VYFRTLPIELGRLVESHRPLHPALGLAIPLTPALPFAVYFGLESLVGAMAVLLGLGLPFTYALAENFLLKHDLYEHGIVFRSIPGLNRYVIPHQTIDPDSFEIGGRRLHEGGVVASVDRRFRQCPLIEPTIRFDGLDPKFAARLGKRRISWQDALEVKERNRAFKIRVTNRWMATYRDPERHLELIRSTVQASQARSAQA